MNLLHNSLLVCVAAGQAYTAYNAVTFKPVSVEVGNAISRQGLFFSVDETKEEQPATPPVPISNQMDAEWAATNEKAGAAYDKAIAEGKSVEEATAISESVRKPPAKAKLDDPISSLSPAEVEEFKSLIIWGGLTSTPQHDAIVNSSPALQRAMLSVARNAAEMGLAKPVVNSMWRSREDQASLKRNLKDRPVGSPDGSPHRHGNAVDLSSATVELLEQHGILAKHELFVPTFIGEAWHVELAHNWVRYDKSLLSEAIAMSRNGLTGAQMWEVATKKGWTTAPYRLRLVERYANQWATAKGYNPKWAVQQAATLYYMETSYGQSMISATRIVGHMQISKRTSAKLNLKNPISIQESTYAALNLIVLNGAERSPLKNFAKHNLGTPTYNAAVAAVRQGTKLTDAARNNILLNLPKTVKDKLGGAVSDLSLIKAYNNHVRERASKILIGAL